MKKLNLVVAIAVALTLVVGGQARAATESADAVAQIVAAISILNTDDLDFGQVVAGGTEGTVVMTPGGARTVTGGTTLGNAGSAGPATFTVTGGPNATYAITLPTSITLVSGSDNMTVNMFTSNPNGSGLLNGGGTQSLSVGGTLHMLANQPTGNYAQSFDVTVAYN